MTDFKYRMLLAMDCDGCYEDSMDWYDASQPGIVKAEQLEALEELGMKVIFVSDSPLCYTGWQKFGHIETPVFDDYVLQRLGALREAAKKYPAPIRMYVSDNFGDEHIAAMAKFTVIHPQNWAKFYKELTTAYNDYQWLNLIKFG